MPPGFKFPEIAELWVPLALTPQSWTRNDHGLGGVAQTEGRRELQPRSVGMDAIAQGNRGREPHNKRRAGRQGYQHARTAVGRYSEALMVLLGTVGCVCWWRALMLPTCCSRARRPKERDRRANGAGRQPWTEWSGNC